MNASQINVDTKHPMFKRFEPEYLQIDDCIEGERQIKHRRFKYLPKSEAWSMERYAKYLLRARFLNATGRTKAALLGIAFQKPVSVAVHGALKELEQDSDGQGKSLVQLARDCVGGNLSHGRGGILADFNATAEDGLQTLANAGRVLLRHFGARNIINWRTVGGCLTLLVLKYEEEEEAEGFECYPVVKWLELRMIQGACYYRVWRYNGNLNAVNMGMQFQTSQVEQEDELKPLVAKGSMLLYIPFAWYGSENNDQYPDVPPLSDIASLNIGHYQSDADVAEAAFQSAQATGVISGLTETWAKRFMENGVAVGSTEALLLPVGGAFEIVQGKDTTMSTELCTRREKQMAMLGAKLIERGSGSKTATQAGDEASTDNSILSQCVGNVEQCINQAMLYAADFVDGKGQITLNKVYTQALIDSQALAVMLSMLQQGTLTLRDFIIYQQNAGIADPTKTPEQLEDDIRNQAPLPGSLMGGDALDEDGNQGQPGQPAAPASEDGE